MIWVGIGLIIIGLALFALVGILIKPLTKASGVLDNLKLTTKDLPEKLDDILTQVNGILQKVHGTLEDINGKLAQLNPLFHLVGDLGKSTRSLSSKLVQTVDEFKEDEPESSVKRNNLESVYGLVTLIGMIFQRGKARNNVVDEQ